MAPADADNQATPMASDINAAARAARDKALAALDAAESALDAQFPSLSDSDKISALKQLNDIDNKREAITRAFVDDIFNSQAHQAIVDQITTTAQSMSTASEQVKQAAQTLTSTAQIIGYAAQLAGFFVSLAG